MGASRVSVCRTVVVQWRHQPTPLSSCFEMVRSPQPTPVRPLLQPSMHLIPPNPTFNSTPPSPIESRSCSCLSSPVDGGTSSLPNARRFEFPARLVRFPRCTR